mgnify:CR=1 FL=1
MRNRFDRQLLELNNELIQMGSLIEQAIEMGISALVKQDVEKAEQAIKFDVEVDEEEKTIGGLYVTYCYVVKFNGMCENTGRKYRDR